jgi:acetyl-CoA carboxylase carboxyl transferase subunit beta
LPLPNPFHREPRHLTLPQPEQRDLPSDLWVRCENERCRQQLYIREWERNLKVCQKCDHHFRLSANERIAQLADEDTFEEQDTHLRPADPLGFSSLGQTYLDKVRDTQVKTGLTEAAICGHAMVEGHAVELGVLDFGFMGGSMGSVVGEKIARSVERATATSRPFVAVSSSGGARMQEGTLSLLQMAKTSAALARLGEARLPFISVLTDPTTGGVTASFAGLGDVLIGEPGAIIGFAGPRVIEQITKQKLPHGAQRSEFLMEHGMLDMVVHRRDLRSTLGRLLRLYTNTPATSNGRS